MPSYYSVTLNFAGAPAEYHPKIEAALAPVTTDWMRFTNYQYVVATNVSAQQIYQAVKPAIPDGSFVLVLRTDIADRSGWASQLIVDWLKRHAP